MQRARLNNKTLGGGGGASMWFTSSLTSKKQSSCSALLQLAVLFGQYWNVCRWLPSVSITRMLSQVPVGHSKNQSDNSVVMGGMTT